MITYGPCADGKCRVAVNNTVIATPYDDEDKARKAASQMAAGRKILRTVFALFGKAVPPPVKAVFAVFEVLDLSVKKIKRAIEDGKHDGDLKDMAEAEEKGKNRKGVRDAIKERRKAKRAARRNG